MLAKVTYPAALTDGANLTKTRQGLTQDIQPVLLTAVEESATGFAEGERAAGVSAKRKKATSVNFVDL